MSVAGRARIAAAQRARWAKFERAAKKEVKSLALSTAAQVKGQRMARSDAPWGSCAVGWVEGNPFCWVFAAFCLPFAQPGKKHSLFVDIEQAEGRTAEGRTAAACSATATDRPSGICLSSEVEGKRGRISAAGANRSSATGAMSKKG
jgi:hypothetical protein